MCLFELAVHFALVRFVAFVFRLAFAEGSGFFAFFYIVKPGIHNVAAAVDGAAGTGIVLPAGRKGKHCKK